MRNKNKLALLLLVLIVIIGGFLRFYKITENPPSLTGDEISFGYAAYSILETGRDESGKFMPLVIQSIGDYKNPLPAYMMVLAIKLFGMNDFAVRFQNAFFGTITIILFYLFILDIFKRKSLAILGALFMAISSWHIFYSRFAYEPLIASTFAMLGIWFFMKMLNGKKYWGVLSALFFAMTMYTGFAPRLFIPIFIFFAILFNFKGVVKEKGKYLVFIVTLILLAIPLVYVSIYQGASTRFSMVFLANDVDFVRNVNFDYLKTMGGLPYLFFFWVKRYLNYLQPDFIFFNALQMTLPNTLGLGILYLFELPWLVLGVVEFIRGKIPFKSIFVIWLLTGIIPDSLTNNQQHAGRLLHIAPVVIIIVALGALKFYEWLKGLKNTYLKVYISGVYLLFILLFLIHACLVFAVHFPRHKGESFDEGIREAVLYIKENQDKYSEVVFDTRHGVEGPYLISNPHMYLLFYTKYDPAKYQTIEKTYGSDPNNPFFNFDKYTFRYIDWPKDSVKKDTLFIGSPWSFPKDGLKDGELLEKIMLSNGYPAYYIVNPK